MEKLTKGWVQHLRNTSRQATAPRRTRRTQSARREAEEDANLEPLKAHVGSDSSKHPTSTGDSDAMEEASKNSIMQGTDDNKAACSTTRSPQGRQSRRPTAKKRPVSDHPEVQDTAEDELDRLNLASDGTESSCRGNKRLCSPPASIVQQRGSLPSTPSRSRTRQTDSVNDFDRGIQQRNSSARRLWVPDDDRQGTVARSPRTPQTRQGHSASASTTTHHHSPRQKLRRRHQNLAAHSQSIQDDACASRMIRQPHTRPISSEQLVAEVRGIYAGLVLLEAKCIEYDKTQRTTELNEEQYHALISLHQSLLHEHHDFFLASQHPSASDALKRLASKYTMPARMWRHAIHSFLELLRQKLPGSLEYMLAFIYIAYTMMALLSETVPAFKDTWVECLGDLGRYRMAIEDNDLKSREVWTDVSKYWYSQASDRAPMAGRLYHHLAILARPNILQQLYFYAKSLCVHIPFESARDSVMTLFDPLLDADSASKQRPEPASAAFVRVHGILFSGKAVDQLQASKDQFLDLLDSRISIEGVNWLESGYHMGIALGCLLLGFGKPSNVLMRAISAGHNGTGEGEGAGEGAGENDDASLSGDLDAAAKPDSAFNMAAAFAEQTYKMVAQRGGDKNTLSFVHTMLAFYLFMSRRPAAMKYLEDRLPWKLTSILLNHLLGACDVAPRIETRDFPGPEKSEPPHPLPEDYAMRGLIYADDYFPQNWFDNDTIEADEKYFERPSTTGKRRERILWIGCMLARHEQWLFWNPSTRLFTVPAKYDVELRDSPAARPGPW